MNRKQNLEVFAKTPVRKAVLLQIVPAVASQMVTLVYNLADTYFVGMLNAPMKTARHCGLSLLSDADRHFQPFGAVARPGPSGRGGRPADRRCLSGRRPAVRPALLRGVPTAGRSVLHLCGATEATYAAAYGYAKWVVILGGPFTILNTLLANLVRAEGGAGAAAFGVSFGGVLNILLDPLFVLPQFLGL